MLKRILVIVIVFVSACLLKSDIIPFVSDDEWFVHELIHLADDPNHVYHLEELEQLAQAMGTRLNGTLIIAKNDTVLVEHSFGQLQLFKSDENYPMPIPPEKLVALRNHPGNQMTNTALFDLASVSKQFTAAAILKLCADGKINLNDTLGKYLPELPYRKVTIKQLLAHTSGIPEYFSFDYKLYDTSLFVDNEQLMRVLACKRFGYIFRPGSKFEYTNTNYAILAHLVEKVSNMDFETFVHENLWKPAGMEHTLFFTELVGADDFHKEFWDTVPKGQVSVDIPPEYDLTEVNITRGHWKSGAKANYDRLNCVLGDKGVYSNVEDLVRWANAYFIDYKIVPKNWVDQATQMQNKLKNGKMPDKLYGYGLRIENSPEHGTLIYHGGLWNGYLNLFLYRPKDGTIIVFLSNYYNGAHRGKSNQVFSIIDKIDSTETTN